MWNLARIAKHPLLSGYFELVHPFFWPVLLWQLMKVATQIDAAGSREALIYISWWGGVRIEYLGDKVETPSAHKLFSKLRDWANPMPAPATLEAFRAILPRLRNEAISLQYQLPRAFAHADTS